MKLRRFFRRYWAGDIGSPLWQKNSRYPGPQYIKGAHYRLICQFLGKKLSAILPPPVYDNFEINCPVKTGNVVLKVVCSPKITKRSYVPVPSDVTEIEYPTKKQTFKMPNKIANAYKLFTEITFSYLNYLKSFQAYLFEISFLISWGKMHSVNSVWYQ